VEKTALLHIPAILVSGGALLAVPDNLPVARRYWLERDVTLIHTPTVPDNNSFK
jgi:hypothetical protein